MSLDSREQKLGELSFEELEKLAAELELEDEEIKKVRHRFIDEFWRRVPERRINVDELGDGEIIGIRMGGEDVLLAKVEGKIHAVSNRCPHRGFPLHMGKLENYGLSCANHAARFDIRTGACLKHPTETHPCQIFRVEVLEDGTVECKAS